MKLDWRTRELIAVGASVSVNCQPCLEYHASEALKNGADEEEIREALSVGRTVRKGAAFKMDKFAADLTPAEAPCPGAGEGCDCEK
jgi:AhpD family alkylhydroperoxidase